MDSAPLLIPEGPWTEVEGSVLAPAGFTANGMYSKMRAGAKGDLALVVCEEGAVAAGAFTQNVMCAAPVTVCKEVLAKNNKSIKAVRVSEYSLLDFLYTMLAGIQPQFSL
jgi:glutamate N-acetyltransferase / amino-acid N-acetyltransferase